MKKCTGDPNKIQRKAVAACHTAMSSHHRISHADLSYPLADTKNHTRKRAPTTASSPPPGLSDVDHGHAPRLPPLPFPSSHHHHLFHVAEGCQARAGEAARRHSRSGGRGGAPGAVPGHGGGGGGRGGGVQGVLRHGGERGELRRVRREREQEGRGGVRVRGAGGVEGAAGVQGGEGHQRHGQRVLQPAEAVGAGVPHVPRRVPGAGAGRRRARQPRALRRRASGPDRVGGRRAVDGAEGRRRAALLRVRDRRRRRAQPHLRDVRAEQAVRALRDGAQPGVEPRRGRPPPAAPVVQDRRPRRPAAG